MATVRSPTLDEMYIDTLELIAEGKTDKEIGKQLYLTEDGIKSRVRVCLRRLGANSRAQAVAEAHWHRLLPRVADTQKPKRALTNEQRWDIALLAEGLTYGQIGARYDRSENTIKARVRDIRLAIGAHNAAQLVHLAFVHGLFPAGWDGGDRRGR